MSVLPECPQFEPRVVWSECSSLAIAYFGVMSLKSSILILPAGVLPTVMSKNTIGRAAGAGAGVDMLIIGCTRVLSCDAGLKCVSVCGEWFSV